MSLEIIVMQILILFVLVELVATCGLWWSLMKNKNYYEESRNDFKNIEAQYIRDREYFDKRLLQWEDEKEKLLLEKKQTMKALQDKFGSELNSILKN